MQRVNGVGRGAAEIDHNVAASQTCGVGGRAGVNLGNQHTPVPRQRVLINHPPRECRGLRRDAEHRPTYAAVSNERRHHVPCGVDRHGERNALPSPDNCRVDAHHHAAARDQGSTRIAGIERSIGLQEILHQPSRARPEPSAQGADHAGGDAVLKPEGIPNRDDQLSRQEARRIAERHGGEAVR